MENVKIKEVILFSFCSTLTDFLLLENNTVYPRDRIIHIIISAAFSFCVIYFFQIICNKNILFDFFILGLITVRFIFQCKNYIDYFHIFHGTTTLSIILFTVLVMYMFIKYIPPKTYLLYHFGVIVNILMLTGILLLTYHRFNVINIYSNCISFEFSSDKLFYCLDIFYVYILVDDKKKRISCQKIYLLATAIFMIAITLIQGLTVSGNILYSLSPLQSLMQIVTTHTVKRFDYIFAVFFTFNYFAAVMIYIWAVKKINTNIREFAGEKN